MGTSKKHPWEVEAARTGADTKTKNTHRDPEPPLIVLDKPPVDTDSFILVHPGGKKTVHRPKKLLQIDDAHAAIEIKVLPAHPGKADRYTLVQKRADKALHVIFEKIPAAVLTREKEDSPRVRAKQYTRLAYARPDTQDPDLIATPVDYAKVVAIDPKIP